MKSKCGKFVRLDKDAAEVVDKLVAKNAKLLVIITEREESLDKAHHVLDEIYASGIPLQEPEKSVREVLDLEDIE